MENSSFEEVYTSIKFGTEKTSRAKSTDEKPKKPKTTWQIFYAAISVNLASIAAGAFMTWLSPALPYLRSNATYLPHAINQNQEGWIGSLAALGAASGAIPSGLLADGIGRCFALWVTAAFLMTAWLMTTLASGKTAVAVLLAARFVGGMAVGAVFTIVAIYIGEISTPHARGTLGTLLQLFVCIGFLVPYAIGPWISYTLLGVYSGLPLFIFLLFFFFCPETPNHLLSKNKREKSEKSLRWLRGSDADISQEMNILEESLRKQPRISYLKQLNVICKSRACWRGLELGFALLAFQQFSGINAILFFDEIIFIHSGIEMDPAIATIIIGVVLTLAALLSSLLTLVFSTRALLMSSSAGLVITNATMSAYFVWLIDDDRFGWVILVTMISYIVVYCVGWGPLPWAVIGEVFSHDVKGLASGLCGTVCWLLCFFVTRFFGTINRHFGFHVTFGIFAVCSLVSGFFAFFRIPHTKGKTLQEIQDMLAEK